MSTNLAPIPSRLPAAAEAYGQLGPANPMVGAGAGPKTNPIIRYLAALQRYKWLVLFLVLCGAAGGYFMSRLLPESYIVKGSLYVTNPVDQGGGAATGFTNEQWRDFIGGYKVIEPVVRNRKLFITGPKKIGGKPLPPGPSGPDAALFNTFVAPEADFAAGNYELQIDASGKHWTLKDTDRGDFETGSVGDSIGRKFGFQWQPFIEPRWYGQSYAFSAVTPREAADALKGDLEIDPRTRFIYLTLTGQLSNLTAATLNDVLEEAVAQAIINKRSNLTQNADMMEKGLNESEANLHSAERDVTEFQTKNITLPKQTLEVTPGLRSTSAQGYGEFLERRRQLDAMERDRGDLVKTLGMLREDSVGVTDRFLSIGSVLQNEELTTKIKALEAKNNQYSALLLAHRPNYVSDTTGAVINMPQMKNEIDKLRDNIIPALAKTVIDRMDSNIARARTDVSHATSELEGMPSRMITENALQRQLAQAEKVQAIMSDRVLNARLQEKSALNDISVYDRAVPPLVPKKNRKKVILALGILLGLGSGLAIAFLLDLMDKRVRYADQITGGLGLTILGVVPEIKSVKGERSTVEEDAQVTEAFRTIRLNLSHAAADGRLAITITSPAPGEGKSLVSSNLAASFAEAGYRTVLIDGDTRRGELHRTFGIDRRPGLIDHLADDHPILDLLHATTHPLLQVVPSGSRKRNAPELLGGKKMAEVLRIFREKFDVVIVDSPPLAAGIDPFVLGTLTGNLMMVVRAGATQKDLAEAKLQIVDQLPIRLVGAVLNDVHSSSATYQYYSYSSGYAAVDETGDEKALPSKTEVGVRE